MQALIQAVTLLTACGGWLVRHWELPAVLFSEGAAEGIARIMRLASAALRRGIGHDLMHSLQVVCGLLQASVWISGSSFFAHYDKDHLSVT